VPSEVAWEQGGVLMRLTQDTLFTEAETTRLTLHAARPGESSVRTRGADPRPPSSHLGVVGAELRVGPPNTPALALFWYK
jgi:hypothetical protein